MFCKSLTWSSVSYAKVLEVLIYSRPTLVLCGHTAPASPSSQALTSPSGSGLTPSPIPSPPLSMPSLQGSNALSPERKDETSKCQTSADSTSSGTLRSPSLSRRHPLYPRLLPPCSTASASTLADGPAPDEGGAENGKRQTYRIDYSLSRMDDVYALRVPWLQIVGGRERGHAPPSRTC
ncbi:hypothetical protein B0H14DRAFT_3532098 [Mycena olivaceomarginata]|nr:hypothetical protein B0H14DRAFT_3532098 [Mycena olivaceomarginata]